jgi:MOSC domain-containing protein YiiM
MQQILSIQVGAIADYPVPGRPDETYQSAMDKLPVNGPLHLGIEGLDGDAQADRKNHGGPFRAVNVYPSEHYALWRQVPGLEGMGAGAFGENFTTRGMTEGTVCIGDAYRLGEEVVVTITQPRGPCYKLNRRWNMPDLEERSAQLGLTGWYLAVRQPGSVRPGIAFELLERPNPAWTVARVWALYSAPAAQQEQAALREMAGLAGLSDGWREWAVKKLAG